MNHSIRVYVTALACVAAAGCTDDSPSAPSAPMPLLAPGVYALTFLPQVNANSPEPCPEATLAATSVTIPVVVSGATSPWTIQPGSEADLGFRAHLEAGGTGISGAMNGAARDPESGVVVSVSDLPPPGGALPGFPAVVAGHISSTRTASGLVGGQVRLTFGTLARRCHGNLWRLEAR